jgi:hypothetical protein
MSSHRPLPPMPAHEAVQVPLIATGEAAPAPGAGRADRAAGGALREGVVGVGGREGLLQRPARTLGAVPAKPALGVGAEAGAALRDRRRIVAEAKHPPGEVGRGQDRSYHDGQGPAPLKLRSRGELARVPAGTARAGTAHGPTRQA